MLQMKPSIKVTKYLMKKSLASAISDHSYIFSLINSHQGKAS